MKREGGASPFLIIRKKITSRNLFTYGFKLKEAEEWPEAVYSPVQEQQYLTEEVSDS